MEGILIVKSWANGKLKKDSAWNYNNLRYGFRFSTKDKETILKMRWTKIILIFPFNNGEVTETVEITGGFYNECNEIRPNNANNWFMENNMLCWESGNPYSIELIHIENNIFRVALHE